MTRSHLTDEYIASQGTRFSRLLKKCPRFIQDKDLYRQTIGPILDSGDSYRICYMGYHLMSFQKKEPCLNIIPGHWEDEMDLETLAPEQYKTLVLEPEPEP